MTHSDDDREAAVRVLSVQPAVEPDGEPTAQTLGEDHFTLLAVVPAGDVEAGERLALDPEAGDDRVSYVRGRLRYDDLTQAAEDALPGTIEAIIADEEDQFVRVFNEAGPLTVRRHALDLLPGVGQTIRDRVIEARRREPFETLAEVDERVDGLSEPAAMLAERIMEELQGQTRHHLFVDG